jgi:AraC-like DNA-binding protein
LILHQPTISAQIVRHVRDCLELAGVDSAPLLAQHGIALGQAEDHDQVALLADYVSFFESAAIAAGNPHFGLHAGKVMSAGGLGPLSFLFLSAPTLAKAFQTFTEYLDAMQESTFNAFAVERTVCHFTYAIRDDGIAPRRQDSEYSIAVMCNLVRQYLGTRSRPAEVHFEHERQGTLALYESYFDCPVYFEQPHNRLYLPKELLGRSSTALSSELFPIIAGHLRARMQEHDEGQSVTDQVRDLLMAHSSDSLPGLDAAAKRFGWSRATLLRKLRREGMRFGDLAAERRLGFARSLLIGSTRSIADIALASGYAETASFTRAFRRSAGLTPSQWRKSGDRNRLIGPNDRCA